MNAQQLQQELIDEAVRAYQRRLHIAYKMPGGLLTLKTVDDKLDRLLSSVASFGPKVLDHPSLRQAYEQEASRMAATYLRCALAAQMYREHPRELEPVVAFHAKVHANTTAWALGAFPVGEHDFDFDCAHLAQMLTHSDPLVVRVAVMALGHRAGMSQCALLLAQRKRWHGRHSDELDRTFDRVQAQLGLPVETDQWSSNMQRHGVGHALQMLAYNGQAGRLVSVSQLVKIARSEQGDAQEMAWTLALLADRTHALSELMPESENMPESTCHRLWAFAGHWTPLARQFKSISGLPLSHSQQDLLACSLGAYGLATLQASPPEQLQGLLREQVLTMFFKGHIDLHNEADVAAWDSDQMVAQPMHAVQMRWGRCLPIGHGQPVQEQAYHMLSSRMRRALLWELRHWRSPRVSFGPDPLAHTRLQMAWLQTQQDAAAADVQA